METTQNHIIFNIYLEQKPSIECYNVEIPIDGYVTLSLQLGTNTDVQLDVPFLVTSEKFPISIIGFNVVKVIADSHQECSLVKIFRSAIVSKI